MCKLGEECCSDLPLAKEVSAPVTVLVPNPCLQDEMKGVSFGFVVELLEAIAALSLLESEASNTVDLKEVLNSPLNTMSSIRGANWIKGFSNLMNTEKDIIRCIATFKLNEAQSKKQLLLAEIQNKANEYKARVYKSEQGKKTKENDISIASIPLLQHLNEINTEIRKSIRKYYKKYYAKVNAPVFANKKCFNKCLHRIIVIPLDDNSECHYKKM
eukprot:TRINITY_DN6442_c0_g1_i6.p2 TRINITY_DN6442_c0_g1~~TRINITY_DN6442_c0_g1_i6.p2  ORF type:complete len:215 (-),score=57.64 TRINITY_DN6442_c0_g1_i6:73-717(-)